MKIITTRQRVLRYDHVTDFKAYQILYKYYYIFGIKFFQVELDKEDIPSYALIARACFGDTSGWRSKFMPFESNGWKD
jgi:hypothetical protein